ncbi:MAG: sulfatase-like hydrolase/transferase [Acidobacteria bacterium]|nr:sulfatase-like hydrolase/transferase [Acidobacteriota bacterium]
MRRALFSWIAPAALLGALGCGGGGAPPEASGPARPNIVFILADDLGYGETGPYGQTVVPTPYLDRLAAEGMLFTDAYSGGAVCAPSRSVLMSGLHTGHSPVRANGGGNPIQADDWTIAQVLQPAGYVSAGFGKWGLGDIGTTGVPWEHGFTEFFGYLHQVHAHFYYPEYLWKNDQKFPLEGNQRGVAQGKYSADVIHEQALAFLRNHARLSQALRDQSPENRESPLFLYLAYTLPHGEYQVPEDSLAPFHGRFDEKPIPAQGEHAAQPEPLAAYAGMISRLDRQVGEVMKTLDELGMAENTLVIFTSDNGPSPPYGDLETFDSNGPLRGRKGQLYEGGIRVPFLVRWKGRIAPGVQSNRPIGFWDVLPTLAELAGTQPPQAIDGVSFAPTLLGENAQPDRNGPLYWEHPGGQFEDVYQAVRLGDWKGIRTAAGKPLELYNLAEDIGETRDLSGDQPEIVQQLEAAMAEQHAEPRPHFSKGWTP